MKTTQKQRPDGLTVGLMVCLGLALCLAQGAMAQRERLMIPVTFYDFHSDRSNPEFEQPHTKEGTPSNKNGLRRNMVLDTLDSEGKPIARHTSDNRDASAIGMARGIRFWFRDWSKLENSAYWSAPLEAAFRSRPGNVLDTDGWGASNGYLRRFRPIYTYNPSTGSDRAIPPDLRQNGDQIDYISAPNNSWREGSVNGLTWLKNAYTSANANIPGYGKNSSGTNTVLTRQYSVDTAFTNKVLRAEMWFNLENEQTRTFKFERNFDGQGNQPGRGFYPLSQAGGIWNDDGHRTGSSGDNNTVYYRSNNQSNTYEPAIVFLDPASTAFKDRWISTKGSVNEGATFDHNWAFTMEMHTQFTMKDGLTFSFVGDDDVWVFINRKLAVDLGGIKERQDTTIDLNRMRISHGLQNGETYDFHLFYAERHSEGSNIRIVTNIIDARFTGMNINIASDTITAGVPALAVAEIKKYDKDGEAEIKDFSKGTFTWTARDLYGVNTNSTVGGRNPPKAGGLSIGSNSSTPLNKTNEILVTAEKAYTLIEICGLYEEHGIGSVDTCKIVYVKPGPAAKVVIEGSADSLWKLNSAAPLDAIHIQSNSTMAENFFAILRDQYDNWVSVAGVSTTPPFSGRTIQWGNTEPNIVMVASSLPDSSMRAGRGRVFKINDMNTDPRPLVYANYTINAVRLPQSNRVPVVIHPFAYTHVRIIDPSTPSGSLNYTVLASTYDPDNVGPSGNIVMDAGGTKILMAMMLRGDGSGKWDTAAVQWSIPAGPETAPPGVTLPNGLSDQFPLTPTAPAPYGTTTIRAANPTDATRRVNVVLTVRPGDPKVMRLFDKKGVFNIAAERTNYELPPATVAWPYPEIPATVEVRAGVRMNIFAKMFYDDRRISDTTWLRDYEDNGAGNGGVWRWEIITNTNDATINGMVEQSSAAVFHSTKAHQTYGVRVTFTKGNNVIQQYVDIKVVPDYLKTKLVIEPNAQAPWHVSQKIERLTMASSVDSSHLYAVIRDQYNNFVAFSGGENRYVTETTQNTEWSMGNNNVITLTPGDQSQGEALIVRKAGDSVLVTATNRQWLGLDGKIARDSVWVVLLGYDYDDVKIVAPCKWLNDKKPNSAGEMVDVIHGEQYCIVSDTLKLTTNDDVPLYVVGHIDQPSSCKNGNCWERIPDGAWGRDENLRGALSNPPPKSDTWLVSPLDVGEGNIQVTRPGKNELNGHIPVIITQGPPTSVVINVLDVNNIFAGIPFKAEVQYHNRHGLIKEWDPSWGSLASLFLDTLVNPSIGSWIAQVITDGGSKELYGPGAANKSNNGAVDPASGWGVDTVSFIIYRATVLDHDNRATILTHRIHLTQTPTPAQKAAGFSSPLTALSNTFRVQPDPTPVLNIVSDQGKTVKGDGENAMDTIIFIHGDGDAVLRAVAEDKYGNRLGDLPSDWRGGEPSAPGVPGIRDDLKNRPIIVYEVSKATEDGWVSVCAKSGDVETCVIVKIVNVGINAARVITRDVNGSGYLDQIEIKFSGKVQFTAATAPVNNRAQRVAGVIVINRSPNHIFTVLDIEREDDTTFIVKLDEGSGSAALQTGWRPTVVIKEGIFERVTGTDTSRVNEQTHCGDGEPATTVCVTRVVDGAPPVIKSALLWFPPDGTGKVEENYITVTFSEKISSTYDGDVVTVVSGDADLIKFNPNKLFSIWEDTSSSLTKRRMAKRAAKQRKASSRSLARAKADDFDAGFILKGCRPGQTVGCGDYLEGIANVTFSAGRGGSDDTLRFYLTNGREIGPPRDHINIRTYKTGTPVHILDVATTGYNAPGPENRKVPILYGNKPNIKVVAIPNPASPDPTRERADGKVVKPGTIFADHDPTAVRDIRDRGNGGTVIQVPIYVPESPGAKVRCQVKVYDLAGNLVISGDSKNGDAAHNLRGSNGQHTKMDLYWNGYNSKGMMVSPGTYRMVVFISYTGLQTQTEKENATPQKYQSLVGISK